MDKYNVMTYAITEKLKAKRLLEVGLISESEYNQIIAELKEYMNEFTSSF